MGKVILIWRPGEKEPFELDGAKVSANVPYLISCLEIDSYNLILRIVNGIIFLSRQEKVSLDNVSDAIQITQEIIYLRMTKKMELPGRYGINLLNFEITWEGEEEPCREQPR